MPSKILANLFNITSTILKTYQSAEGESIVATGGASAGKGETAEIYSSPGIISRPGAGTKGIRLRFGKIDIILAVYNYGITPPTNPGETKIYSTDADGAEQATTKLLADGTMEINGDSDFAVAFNDLKTQFNELKTAFNTHTHVYIPGTLATVPTATALPQSAANIDAAKVATVKLP